MVAKERQNFYFGMDDKRNDIKEQYGYYQYYIKAHEAFKANNFSEAKSLIETCIQKLENGESQIYEDGNSIEQTNYINMQVK